jgi:hypothetical protein
MEKIGLMKADRLEEMGREARELVEREYGEDRVVRAYLEIVKQLAPRTGV